MAAKKKQVSVKVDAAKLERAKEILRASSDQAAIEYALDIVLTEEKLNAVLQRVKGKGSLEKVFR